MGKWMKNLLGAKEEKRILMVSFHFFFKQNVQYGVFFLSTICVCVLCVYFCPNLEFRSFHLLIRVSFIEFPHFIANIVERAYLYISFHFFRFFRFFLFVFFFVLFIASSFFQKFFSVVHL